jgi:signal transduction histidine kinase
MAEAETGSVQPNVTGAVAALLERIEHVFAVQGTAPGPETDEVWASARERALTTLATTEEAHCAHTAPLFHAADLLVTQAIELAADHGRARELIGRLTETAEVSRRALAREVLRDSSLRGFPPAVAIEVQLGLLMAFARLQDVSLWMLDGDEDVQSVCGLGKAPDGTAPRELARRVLRGPMPSAKRGPLVGLAVKRWHEHAAALVALPEACARESCQPLLEEAIPVLGAILERDVLIRRNVAAESKLSQTYERRLTRLGFDIHDGPLQDLALLGEDVQLLRRQLSDVLDEDIRQIMLGRLDDLQAQLSAIDCDLRRISASLQSPFTGQGSLREAIANMAHAFSARSSIEPSVRLEGDLDELTDSQQMALLSIMREALNNVREHSDASEVTISLKGGPLSIDLEVADNGSGFDVEQTLVRAARDGHFGLIGLHERARLLGGASRIESRPGTKISVMLPRWRAVAPEGE